MADKYEPKTTITMTEAVDSGGQYRLKVILSERFFEDVKKYNRVEVTGINYLICSFSGIPGDSKRSEPELELKLLETMRDWYASKGIPQQTIDDIYNKHLYGSQRIKLASGYVSPEDLSFVIEKRNSPTWVPV